MTAGSKRVVHDLLEVLLVLLRTNEAGLELDQATPETTERRFRAPDRIPGGEELTLQVGVALLGRTDELTEPVDLGPQRGRVLVVR